MALVTLVNAFWSMNTLKLHKYCSFITFLLSLHGLSNTKKFHNYMVLGSLFLCISRCVSNHITLI